MRILEHLFEQNRAWSARIQEQDPDFFTKLKHQQAPEYLWIGCSDSRVPANQIVDMLPGAIFVHRNVANVVTHTDLNCLSVMQFAVDVLKVKHIIVCGHYGCGGVKAAICDERHGLIDNWLRHILDIYKKHQACFAGLDDDAARINRLCELNVIEQVVNVCQTTIVQDTWARGQRLTVHGWIYGVHDGLLRDLDITVTEPEEITPAYEAAIQLRMSA